MSPRKVSSSVVHELPADLRKALTSDPKALSAVGPSHATSGSVGLSQRKKRKQEAAGSSGTVPT